MRDLLPEHKEGQSLFTFSPNFAPRIRGRPAERAPFVAPETPFIDPADP
jgi:hypothetical protein